MGRAVAKTAHWIRGEPQFLKPVSRPAGFQLSLLEAAEPIAGTRQKEIRSKYLKFMDSACENSG
jgi:hypothetical protein